MDLVYGGADTRPNHTALVHGAERLTYADLAERVERLAHGLACRGIRAGDRVALLLPSTPAFVTSFFAVTGLGGVAVPLNPQFKRDELEFCFRSCKVRAVIADQQAAGLCEQIAASWDYPIQVIPAARGRNG